MLTAEGCLARRKRLWERLDPPPESDYLLLGDPMHLIYLANFWVDPISLGAGFAGYLLVRRDGHAKLLHDNRLPGSVHAAHVDERRPIPWYDGRSPAHGARQLAVLETVNPSRSGLRVHDRPGDPYAAVVINTLAEMRRQKDEDEVALLRSCMIATNAGHAWARANIQAGMSELDVYTGVVAECTRSAGMPVIVYGDFIVCTGLDRKTGHIRNTGPPTSRTLVNGDLFILDFSVVIGGYRSDFTNTLCVGREPRASHKMLFQLTVDCLALGEAKLRAGVSCQEVYDASVAPLRSQGMYDFFPSHIGHGLGLSHPEAPFIVRNSTETLRAGDVVTLEPGIYPPGGGLRLEHNYLITETGFERLSGHELSLT